MSNLNSWEDDPAAQEENLAQQTQQMNLNSRGQTQQGGFRAGAASFTPGAASFQPGQAYGGGFAPQGYGGYNQYGGQYGQQQYDYTGVYGQGQGGYQQAQYGQYGGYQQQPQQQYYQPQQQQRNFQNQRPPQQQQQQQAPAAAPAAAPSNAPSAPAPKPVDATTKPAAQPKAKVLSIGVPAPAPAPAKEAAPAAASASAPAPAKEESKEEKKEDIPTKAEAGSKATASKAMEKANAKESASGKTSPTPASGRSSPSRATSVGRAPVKARDMDAIAVEQTADVDDTTLKELYGKEHINIIFMGHVDAGKSTLGGAILYATGMVDQRTLDKYKREAKEMGRETWYLSWALDLTNEERMKGKTVEVGRGYFETEKRRYSILDAPGHKNYVPNMIGGASQADVGVLVISARKGEYETGFERGGQTREHAMLAKTQGVNKLVVVVNKMDDPTVQWSQDRFKECTTKLAQFLKGTGYNLKNDVHFMPVAAQTATGIKDRVPKDICSWYDGPSLLEYLDSMQTLERKLSAPFMMVVAGKYRDLGTMIEGKIEAGVVKKGMSLQMMPNKQAVEVTAVYTETEEEVGIAQCGDQVRLRLRGIEEEDILQGFVLCSPKRPVHCVSAFEAHVRIIDLPNILTAGFNCVLHIHAAIEEVTFSALLHTLQKGTGRKSKRPPTHAKKGDDIIARLEVIGGAGSVCVEKFEDYPTMGRFTLRDQGQTIAIGKITKLITDDSS
ncbi:P-loop containing nucleoside triphosphate hydrolase protein [Diplogelasinospora grovesii]|uniref:Elongation factor 1-alpha n=1 Tax=Diplogelasinospora grovesii TaxID=303347 RepID=A0AAN6S403_9PEZI|nr:P-loop containing nucleoside triphosphate hydrolase protein [Diplogelasinospora grovesii]